MRTLRTWYEKFHFYGGEIPENTQKRKRNARLCERIKRIIEYLLEENSCWHFRELQDRIEEEGERAPCKSTLYKFLTKELGLSMRALSYKASQVSEEEAAEHMNFVEVMNMDARMVLSIDETHVGELAYRRRRGWEKKGTRYPYRIKFYTQH
mmetsp:Transcript_16999/g.25518  ORF Transcript_16999/g.25518 Transcript_16999/m.25518 type:complete len:152 (-) Transcript_16999:380-835(-)